MNDQISQTDNSLKLEKLNKISERSDLILSQGYQIPSVLCMKPKCAPKDFSKETRNSASGQFRGEKITISECLESNSNQNISVILKNTAASSDIDLSFGYQAISWIDQPTKEAKTSAFSSMEYQAKDDRPEREARISGGGDSNGNSRADASITFGRDFDDGSRLEISGRASIEHRADGTTTTNVDGGASYRW